MNILAASSTRVDLRRLGLFLMFVLSAIVAFAGCQQPGEEEVAASAGGTDIWLFEISGSDVEMVARVTDRDGYDNQPLFTPDGRSILFSSDRSGRVNTHLYTLESGETTQISFTDADKYSPTPIPGTEGSAFSVVHTDSTVRQGLWKYSVNESFEPAPVAAVDDVAYYSWVGDDAVLFWRLGDPSTLQLLDTITSDTLIVAEDSAFSFKTAASGETFYLASWAGRHSEIRKFDASTRESTVVAPALGDGRNFAVARDGRLLMMDGSELHAFDPNGGEQWEKVADLGITNGSRIAVSPEGLTIAVVGER